MECRGLRTPWVSAGAEGRGSGQAMTGPTDWPLIVTLAGRRSRVGNPACTPPDSEVDNEPEGAAVADVTIRTGAAVVSLADREVGEMLILLITTAATVGGFWLVGHTHYSDWANLAGMVLAIGGGSVLVVGLLGLVFHPLEVRGEIAEFQATASVLEVARADGQTWESAAIQKEVADMNRWLASQQYWNSTVFDLWVPDEVDELQPIR